MFFDQEKKLYLRFRFILLLKIIILDNLIT